MTLTNSKGNLLISVATTMTLFIGLSSTLVVRTTKKQQDKAVHAFDRTISDVADTGLALNFLNLARDPMYAVSDRDGFEFDDAVMEYVSRPIQLTALRPGEPAWLRLRLQYSHAGVPVAFDRARPSQSYDRIRVTSEAHHAKFVRVVQADYEPTSSGSGLLVAYGRPTRVGAPRGTGTIVIDRNGSHENQTIDGPLRANGGITLRGVSEVDVSPRLAGSAAELPRFRVIDEPTIDVERYEAAARSGAGVVFESLEAFRKAAWKAQDHGRSLAGIIVVKWDPRRDRAPGGARLAADEVRFGLSDHLAWTSEGPSFRTRGIEITGTLCLILPDGVSADYRAVFDCAVKINPADLNGVDPADATTFPSGYRKPSSAKVTPAHAIDISGVTGSDGRALRNFTREEDLPALIQNRGSIEFRSHTNISGALFTPGSIAFDNAAQPAGSWFDSRAERIRQRDGVLRSVNGLQYFYGCAIAGGALVVRGNATLI